MKKKNDQIVFLAEAISTYRFNGMQRTNVFFLKERKRKNQMRIKNHSINAIRNVGDVNYYFMVTKHRIFATSKFSTRIYITPNSYHLHLIE